MRSSIDAVQLLHYKSLDRDRVLTDAAVPRISMPVAETAEIVVFYGDNESDVETEDVNRTVIYCKKCICLLAMNSLLRLDSVRSTTRVRFSTNDATIRLEDVESTGIKADESSAEGKTSEVSLQFTTSEGWSSRTASKSQHSPWRPLADIETAARKFRDRLEEMRMELYILSLKHPQPDETVILKL
jgi:hypothetical protein